MSTVKFAPKADSVASRG